MMLKIVFYLFSAILVFAAVRVITVRNPIHAALHLVLAFFASAAIWMLLHAEFLAITLLLVYVGAVMILFLFVVMMLDINIAVLREGFNDYLPLGILIGALILLEMVMVVGSKFFRIEAIATENISNTLLLGRALYNDYVYAFEIAAVILLVAMVAAITLTMRPPRQTKYQHPSEQVKIKREDRVRLLKLPAEKSE